MKYKLIKYYPNGPKLNTIISRRTIGESYWSYNNSSLVLFDTDHPGNYPEFWEKVIEKDYEILSVISNNNIFIEKVYTQDATIEPCWKIHSVKRVSDGEIFTIGDKVDGITFQNKKIVNIRNDIYNRLTLDCGTLAAELKNAKKAKLLLFITEDGVDIYDLKKSDFWYLKKQSFDLYHKIINGYGIFLYEPQKELYFSSKEKAEEYILMNKPCLSINDIAKIYKGLNKTNGNPSTQVNRLKELVKSKIQQSV